MTQSPDTARIEQRTLTANGIRQHYLVAGSGAPLVLLHGWPQHAGAWRRILPALAAGRTVIAPDLRGAGFSDKPATGYDKATLAKDVHALMAALGHARYAVVGHDIGGMIGYALAAQFRDAVSHLAIVDVPLPGIDPWDRMQGAPPLWHFAFHAQRDLAEALIGGRERLYIAAFIQGRAFNPGAVTEAEIDDYARAMAAPGGLRGGLELYRAIAEDVAFNKQAVQQKLAIPVLGIGGDRLGPVMKAIAETVSTQGSGATVKDCGHWVPEERPAEFTALIQGFLK